MTAFEADGITVQQFNEVAGGQVVFHLHVHIMPRHDGVALLPPASRMEDKAVLEAHAAKLIAALKGCPRYLCHRERQRGDPETTITILDCFAALAMTAIIPSSPTAAATTARTRSGRA